MKSQSFSLKPFPSASLLPSVKITGNIERRSKILSISYALFGPLGKAVIPAPADMPTGRLSPERQFHSRTLRQTPILSLLSFLTFPKTY